MIKAPWAIAAGCKFGWVVDPEGNKVELWEPPAGG